MVHFHPLQRSAFDGSTLNVVHPPMTTNNSVKFFVNRKLGNLMEMCAKIAKITLASLSIGICLLIWQFIVSRTQPSYTDIINVGKVPSTPESPSLRVLYPTNYTSPARIYIEDWDCNVYSRLGLCKSTAHIHIINPNIAVAFKNGGFFKSTVYINKEPSLGVRDNMYSVWDLKVKPDIDGMNTAGIGTFHPGHTDPLVFKGKYCCSYFEVKASMNIVYFVTISVGSSTLPVLEFKHTYFLFVLGYEYKYKYFCIWLKVPKYKDKLVRDFDLPDIEWNTVIITWPPKYKSCK